MWFFYALLAAVIWGAGEVIVKKGQSTFSPFIDNVIATLVQVLIIAPLLFISGVNIKAIPATLPYAFIVAVLYMTYYYVISKGQISLVGTVLAGYPVVIVILSLLFLHEALTFVQVIAIISVVSGAIILSLPDKTPKKALHSHKWIIWGVFGAIMVGLAQFFTKIGGMQSDGNTFTFLMGLSYVPALIICGLFDKKGRNLKKIKWKKTILISIIGVAMIETELIPLKLAYAMGPASLVSPVANGNSVIMVILSLLFLKERINKFQTFGIILIIAGIFLIGS